MLIEYLKITDTQSDPPVVIRDMRFEMGINLIIDDTTDDDRHQTGNNVGKTTVLKLIDFCLGADGNVVYTDTETKGKEYGMVKDFLIREKIQVELCLTPRLHDDKAQKVVILRDFIPSKPVRMINGKQYTEKEFPTELNSILFPRHVQDKPGFRQIISHNIRYKELSIDNTLKTLSSYTQPAEYEPLFLYMLGCPHDDGALKCKLEAQLGEEKKIHKKLSEGNNLNDYKALLAVVDARIKELDEKRNSIKTDAKLDEKLKALGDAKESIARISATAGRLNLRKTLIQESLKDLNDNRPVIDSGALRLLYTEAKDSFSGIQKTFEELVSFHDRMADEKARFIARDLPLVEAQIRDADERLQSLESKAKEIEDQLQASGTYDDLENIIGELNVEHQSKGKYETLVEQLENEEQTISDLNSRIDKLDTGLFSKESQEKLTRNISRFNKYFTTVSKTLYGEDYLLSYRLTTDKKKCTHYEFYTITSNFSSGKKQGEALCFDIAYIMFADEYGIDCLHFFLNDKKELMHGNQLETTARYIKGKGMQMVVSMLKDKLPQGFSSVSHTVVELSQQDKLFRIEQTQE